ncbi:MULTISPECIES: hypothetical protein [unclassified Streptomyces]
MPDTGSRPRTASTLATAAGTAAVATGVLTDQPFPAVAIRPA